MRRAVTNLTYVEAIRRILGYPGSDPFAVHAVWAERTVLAVPIHSILRTIFHATERQLGPEPFILLLHSTQLTLHFEKSPLQVQDLFLELCSQFCLVDSFREADNAPHHSECPTYG